MSAALLLYSPGSLDPSWILSHRNFESSFSLLGMRKTQKCSSALWSQSSGPWIVSCWSNIPMPPPAQWSSQCNPRKPDLSLDGVFQKRLHPLCFPGYSNSAGFVHGREQLPTRCSVDHHSSKTGRGCLPARTQYLLGCGK